MAKKTKKTKITETLVNQLQEQPQVVVEEKKKPEPQKSKLFDTPMSEKVDPGVNDINFGLSGIL